MHFIGTIHLQRKKKNQVGGTNVMPFLEVERGLKEMKAGRFNVKQVCVNLEMITCISHSQ